MSKPRHEWGPADELANVIQWALVIIGGTAIVLGTAWFVFFIVGWTFRTFVQ